ncbi:hypothetical protein ACFPJ4_13135 [Lysinimonas soli]|uniref:Uncharacterized protein n=1 Tax=Lysinimonas soli TaxID=1074233 RepID=A0ABW0NSV5_9MICO
MSVERSLREAWGMWSIGRPDPQAVIRLACDGLVEGLDTPKLRELASLSIHNADRHEVRELLFFALSELGERPPDFETSGATLLALQFCCERYLNGELTPRELCSWAHQHVGHEGPAIAQQLVLLDDDMDRNDVTSGVRDFRIETDAAAAAFLDASHALAKSCHPPGHP